jgi:hypothetical protein
VGVLGDVFNIPVVGFNPNTYNNIVMIRVIIIKGINTIIHAIIAIPFSHNIFNKKDIISITIIFINAVLYRPLNVSIITCVIEKIIYIIVGGQRENIYIRYNIKYFITNIIMEEDMIRKIQRQTDMTEMEIKEKLIEFNNDPVLVIQSYFGIKSKQPDSKTLNKSDINKEMYKQFREKLYITPEKQRY